MAVLDERDNACRSGGILRVVQKRTNPGENAVPLLPLAPVVSLLPFAATARVRRSRLVTERAGLVVVHEGKRTPVQPSN